MGRLRKVLGGDGARQQTAVEPRPLLTIEVNFEVGRIEINDRRVLWMEGEEDKESGR